jgi:hypothetical protein
MTDRPSVIFLPSKTPQDTTDAVDRSLWPAIAGIGALTLGILGMWGIWTVGRAMWWLVPGIPTAIVLGVVALSSSSEGSHKPVGTHRRLAHTLGFLALLGGALAVPVLFMVLAAGMMMSDPVLNHSSDWGNFGGVPFGTAQQTAEGNTVTVYSLEFPARPDPGVNLTPSPGQAFAAADVEVCATTAPAYVGWYYVGIPRSAFNSPVKLPAFPDRDFTIPLGSCVRGWRSFQLASYETQLTVTYPDGHLVDGLQWR